MLRRTMGLCASMRSGASGKSEEISKMISFKLLNERHAAHTGCRARGSSVMAMHFAIFSEALRAVEAAAVRAARRGCPADCRGVPARWIGGRYPPAAAPAPSRLNT